MIWKIWMKCEIIWKIWKKSKLKSEKIWKIWRKSQLSSEKIWKIQKKGKLNSEMIWKLWKISVLVIITHRDLPFLLFPPLPPSTSLYTCTYIVFQNWEESSWNSFLLETMQVGIKFTISFIWLLEIPQWERGHPWSTT